jgi:hypothetical protein
VGLILLAIVYLYTAGDIQSMQVASDRYEQDVFILKFSPWTSTAISIIMAAFLGATTIPYERLKSSLNVLLTKPLYRKDYVLGKFFGLAGFMLIFNIAVFLIACLLITICFRGPLSITEFVTRGMLHLVILTLICSLVIALNMLFGIISKNILFVTAATMTYVFIDLLWYSDKFLGELYKLTPVNLYYKINDPMTTTMFPALRDTTVPIGQWLNAAAPYIVILIVEVIILLLIGARMFSKEDNI